MSGTAPDVILEPRLGARKSARRQRVTIGSDVVVWFDLRDDITGLPIVGATGVSALYWLPGTRDDESAAQPLDAVEAPPGTWQVVVPATVPGTYVAWFSIEGPLRQATEIVFDVSSVGQVTLTSTGAPDWGAVQAVAAAAAVSAALPEARRVGAAAGADAAQPFANDAAESKRRAGESEAAAAASRAESEAAAEQARSDALNIGAVAAGAAIPVDTYAALPAVGANRQLYTVLSQQRNYRWYDARPGLGTPGYVDEGRTTPAIDAGLVAEAAERKDLIRKAIAGQAAITDANGFVHSLIHDSGRIENPWFDALATEAARGAFAGSVLKTSKSSDILITDANGNIGGSIPLGTLGDDDGEEEPPVAEAHDTAPIYSDEFFVVSGRTLPLYAPNLWPGRHDVAEAQVTLSSLPAAPAAPLVVTGRGQIDIPADRLGTTAELQVRRDGEVTRSVIPLGVRRRVVPVTGSPAPKICMIGDSISNREGAAQVNQLLTGWGFAPQWIGTLRGMGLGATNVLDATGPLGECREGWAAYGDYLYAIPDSDVTAVVPPGGEAAYLALAKADSRLRQVFVRPSTGSDPAGTVFNGYVFDFSFYLSRFSLATPDIIVLNLWVNDVTEQGAAGVAQIKTGLNRMIDSIRAACPLAEIILWYSSIPRAADADSVWISAYRAGTQAIGEVARSRRLTDSKVHLVSAGAHQTQEAGWAMTLSDADPVTGIAAGTVSDYRHPVGVARAQQFDALAQAVACLSP